MPVAPNTLSVESVKCVENVTPLAFEASTSIIGHKNLNPVGADIFSNSKGTFPFLLIESIVIVLISFKYCKD